MRELLLFPKVQINSEQKQSPEMFYKKGVLKIFAILTGKHLCRNLFKIKLQASQNGQTHSNNLSVFDQFVMPPANLVKKNSNTGAFL